MKNKSYITCTSVKGVRTLAPLTSRFMTWEDMQLSQKDNFQQQAPKRTCHSTESFRTRVRSAKRQ